jgi:hypothetical protein
MEFFASTREREKRLSSLKNIEIDKNVRLSRRKEEISVKYVLLSTYGMRVIFPRAWSQKFALKREYFEKKFERKIIEANLQKKRREKQKRDLEASGSFGILILIRVIEKCHLLVGGFDLLD